MEVDRWDKEIWSRRNVDLFSNRKMNCVLLQY